MCRACSSAAARAPRRKACRFSSKEADAEALDFGDATFDTVLSTFGVMFTPDQDRAASELLRVCKSGGKIGLANWTPDGFIGQLFKTLGTCRRRRREIAGAVGHAGAHHGDVRNVSRLDQGREASLHLPLPLADALDVFRNYYGPTLESLCRLDERNQRRLADDIPKLIASMNRAEDGTMVPLSEYLEIVIVKR